MINTNIRFNGFYDSIHMDNIDYAIESYLTLTTLLSLIIQMITDSMIMIR